MKLVQFARPLFLIALGLHALVLFLPTGSDESETVVVEDVFSEESELTATASKSPATRKVPGDQKLASSPVAEPRALAPRGQKPPKAIAPSSATVAARAAAPRAAATQATRRPAQSTNPAGSGVPTLPAASPSPAEARTNTPQTNTPQANTPQTNATATAPSQVSIIPDLSNQANSQTDSQSGESRTEALPTITALIASLADSVSVPEDLLEEISDLYGLLAYSAQNTDDFSANQNRDDWKADIQRQANVGTVESMAPTEISDLTEIAYPIEASKQADMKARSLSLCLDKKPHDAEVGVLFDSQGNVAGEPALIRSTGYEGINQEIIATVRSYEDFPPNRSSKAYLLEFEIDYDPETCVSLEKLKETEE
ncbi:MAG: hypothetical protein AAF716_13695 [Cyanobacteria bacterium P01_D01_bin.1]